MTGPKRAKKGSIGGQLLLGLSVEMRASVDKCAKYDGVTPTEWIRAAIQQRLWGGRMEPPSEVDAQGRRYASPSLHAVAREAMKKKARRAKR